MYVLLDTNILARCSQPNHPRHQVANDAITALVRRGDKLCLVPQVIYEFFVVCTRPQQENGGLGMSTHEALQEIRRVESLFKILPDSPRLYSVWIEMIEKYSVIGKRAHDARIAAAMITHQVPAILTFNGRDFRRYAELEIQEPLNFARP